MTTNAGTWRVVIEGGAVGELTVEVMAGGWHRVSGQDYHPATPLRAAIGHAAWARDWPVREILAPGEMTAAQRVAAERARCAVVCREVAAQTPVDGIVEVAAHACADAIERGAVAP